jgi:hypothetical protein
MDHPLTAGTKGEGLGWRSTGGHRAQGRHAEGLDAGFVSFVRRRGPHHLRTAVLLTGDWHTAEDLVQACLAKLYRVWDRLDTGVDPDSYLLGDELVPADPGWARVNDLAGQRRDNT